MCGGGVRVNAKNSINSIQAKREVEAMAVLLETSAGDLVIDLFVEDCPKAAKNFLKLVKT